LLEGAAIFDFRIILPTILVSTVTCIAAASAADLPVKAPVKVVAPFNWTGCYVGANAGWKGGRFRDESASVPSTTGTIPGIVGTFTAPADNIFLDPINANSAAAGGQIGCRWQMPQNWVLGVEGDFDWTDLHGTVVNRTTGPGTTFVPGDFFDNRARWESSARVIVGRSWDRLLVYGTGGIAFSDVKMTGNFIQSIGVYTNGRAGVYPASTGSDSQVLVGGTIGAGLAYALNKNWDIGGEYRYTRYQGADYGVGQVAGICGLTTAVPGGVGCFNQNVTGHKSLETNEVLLKVNYRFDWAGPVVAKY
jgi:outer membrane immunogenic protein